jgi:AraC-like DNA-binding protein
LPVSPEWGLRRYAARVRYREHLPKQALMPYVTCFWELTSSGEPHRVLPDGATDVLFEFGAHGAQVIGPMTRAIVTAAAPRGSTCIVGARFRPGAAIDLLGVSARELRDQSVPVADVWRAHGRMLDSRLAEARDARSAIRAIEAELLARVPYARAPDARVAQAVATLRAAGGELPIPGVGEKVGIGERQLERLFDERVGYGPKVFARVVRLERATQAIARSYARGSLASWARLAIDCGYADQAHLVREFRALTGLTPALYARARAVSEIDNPGLGPAATVGA